MADYVLHEDKLWSAMLTGGTHTVEPAGVQGSLTLDVIMEAKRLLSQRPIINYIDTDYVTPGEVFHADLPSGEDYYVVNPIDLPGLIDSLPSYEWRRVGKPWLWPTEVSDLDGLPMFSSEEA